MTVCLSFVYVSFLTALSGLGDACMHRGSMLKAKQLLKKSQKIMRKLDPPSYPNIGIGNDEIWIYIHAQTWFIRAYIVTRTCTPRHSHTRRH